MAKWQPIETAPTEDCGWLLGWRKDRSVVPMCWLVTEWVTPDQEFDAPLAAEGLYKFEPSHWAPLKSPPVDDGIERYSLPIADWSDLMLGAAQPRS